MFCRKNATWKASVVWLGLLFLVISDTHAYFTFSEPLNLGPIVNSPSGDGGPGISADGLSLLFTSLRAGGQGAADLWLTTRVTVDDDWTKPTNLGPTVNKSAWDESPSMSADGLSLYFDSPRPDGQGDYDLWMARRASVTAAWEAPLNLGATINSTGNDLEPFISIDGLSLYFASDRAGGYGGYDLWVAHRPSVTDPWEPPVNLGPTVNSVNGEGNPCVSANGLVLFLGDYHGPHPGGYGGSDIWISTRLTTHEPWGAPVNAGPILNTPLNDHGAKVSVDNTTLYFFSTRPGGYGDYDLWQSTVHPLVDFTDDYKVDIKDLLLLIEHWGQNEPLCDIGPTPLGDGVVDAADLEVLMSHWGQDDHLLAHWKLDETGGDIAYDSIRENHAAVMGDPVWQREMGQIDGALQLDGVDDYVAAPFILDPVKQPFSAFAWIKGGQPEQFIISQQGAFGAWLSVDSSGALATGLTFPMPAVTSNVIVTDDQWHRVGLVSDGTGMSLFVDGIEVARTPTSPILPATGDLQIGVGSKLEPGSFWQGLIDDVQIYDRVVQP